MSIQFIAEIGENHLGDLSLAKALITQAKDAGADWVKFQSYRGRDFPDSDPEKAWFTRVELSDAAHFELMRHAQECGVRFLSAPFSVERARFLVETLGLRTLKIASGVMLHAGLLEYVARSPVTEIFISTGMSRLDEVRSALSALRRIPRVAVLHCVSEYPCPDEDANLLAVTALREAFPDREIGYSDHTLGIDACLGAIALGATVIEKHFTHDKKCAEGTDHVLSAEKAELKELVARGRRIATLRGQPGKGPTPAEQKIRDFVRGRFASS